MLHMGRLLPTLVPVLAPVVLTVALASGLPASAADLGAGFEYGARPIGPEGYGRFEGRSVEEPSPYGRAIERRAEIGECRVVVRRRVNEFGEEVIRRSRICEEQPAVYGRSREPLPHYADGGYGRGSEELVPPADIPDEEGTLR